MVSSSPRNTGGLSKIITQEARPDSEPHGARIHNELSSNSSRMAICEIPSSQEGFRTLLRNSYSPPGGLR